MSANGFDGSIIINTKIDETGFNSGVKDITSRVTRFGAALVGVGAAVTKLGFAIASGLALATAGISVALIAIIGFAQKLWQIIGDSNLFTQQVNQLSASFNLLKGALASAFAPFFAALVPVIIQVVTWLTNVFNILAQIIAALMGQTTYMRAVASGAQDAAAGSGEFAKNTEKAEKAAKGALATFDDLNVLQQDQSETSTPAPGGGGGGLVGGAGGMKFEPVPIDSAILDKIKSIKDTFASVIEWIKTAWKNVQEWIVTAAKNIGEWLAPIWENIKNWAVTAWQNIGLAASSAWEWIKTTWAAVSDWFQQNVIGPLAGFFSGVWEFVSIVAHDAWAVISFLWQRASAWFESRVITPLRLVFAAVWLTISMAASSAWAKVSEVWAEVSKWFTDTVVNPLQKAFETGLSAIEKTFHGIFNGIVDFVRGTINKIIDLINGMISGIVGGFNTVISAANNVGQVVPGWIPIPTVPIPQIPRLATGAVIPPGREFAAILGDQRSGMNIEAPADLIRQIVGEELDRRGTDNITVRFEGTMSALIQVLEPEIRRETRRRGSSLIAGGSPA